MREIHDAGKRMNLTKTVRLKPISNLRLKTFSKVDCLNIRKIEKFLSNQEDPTNEGKGQQKSYFCRKNSLMILK